MKQSPLSTVCRAICRAALAVIASACVMTANAQTISTVLLPADREVYSKQSTSATLFNGEPFIAYKRCATSGCGVVQEIAITYCVSNCGTANPVWRDRVISNAPSSVFGEYVAAAIARDGNPMITWVDVSFAGASPSTVMVARCIAECDSERPRYVSHPVATLASGSLDRIALIDAGASGSGQTVAFIQTAEGQRRLRVATCVTGCASASATYNIATVDNQTGRTTENRISMTAYAGKPIIAYTDFGNDVQRSELRVARCTGACDTASPAYSLSSIFGVTDSRAMNLFSSIAVTAAGDHFVTYQAVVPVSPDYQVLTKVALCMAACETAAPTYSDQALSSPTAVAGARRAAASGFVAFGQESVAVFHAGQDNAQALRRIDYTPGGPIPAPTTVDTLTSGSSVAAVHALGRTTPSLPAYVVYESQNSSNVVRFKLLSYAGVAGSDTTPDAFSFSDQTDVLPGTVVTSDPVSISGIDAPAPISVTGGSYSIGCTATYITTASTIMNGDIVCVRHTSSASLATAVNTTLTIGGVSDVFTSTTQSTPVDMTPLPFSFTDQFDVPTSSTRTSEVMSVSGFQVPVPISVTNGSYSVGCTATYISTASTIAPNDVVCVRHMSAATPLTRVDTVLTIGGVSDTFSSTTAAAGGTDSTPDAFNIPLMSGLTVNTLQRSETIAIRGINTVAPVSVVDGEYSIGCSGTFTSSPGTISNFDTVCVRRTTAATPRTAVTVRLTIGGVSATWYAITAGGATPPVVIVPSPIAHNAFLGVPFTSPAPVVSGGTGPYTFVAYTLPVPGVTLGADGELRGTPTFLGNYSLDFYVVDANGQTSNGRLTVNVSAAAVAEAIAVPTVSDAILLLMVMLTAVLAAWQARRESLAQRAH